MGAAAAGPPNEKAGAGAPPKGDGLLPGAAAAPNEKAGAAGAPGAGGAPKEKAAEVEGG